MKGDEGSVLVVDDNQVNRYLLGRRLQRQRHAASVAEDGFKVNSVLRAARLAAGLEKKLLLDRQQADLQKSIVEEQEKSERLLGKEETNG